MKRRSKGFTLIELSIVLVIIGLIIGGVLVGQTMIKNATIQKTVKQVEQFNTAVNTFRGKYKCLPGDCRDAYKFRFTGADSQSATHPAITSVADLNNGNGDGKIYNFLGGNTNSESNNAFWWMHEAGLLQVPCIPWTNTGSDVIDCAGIAPAWGSNSRATSWGDGTIYVSKWYLTYIDTTTEEYITTSAFGANNEYFNHPAHYYWLTNQSIDTTSMMETTSPADAYAMDAKIDDGLPRSGKVLASGNDALDFDSIVYNPVPVFAPASNTESGPVGVSPTPSSCIASTTGPAYTAPPYIYNVANTRMDYGDGVVGGMCTLTVEASF